MSITYKLDLSRYSNADLYRMYLQCIITKQEMNDELDDRADTRMVIRKSLKVG